jgi:K(+)-stimulated pyrophosphate-energized sodium pump
LLLVILAGFLAVLYGIVQTASLMRASPGNARMQEIAAAIQEGAQAYLQKQYTAIGIVGVVILIIGFFLLGALPAVGFAIGAVLSGLAGFAGMLISVRANVRTAQASSEGLAKGLSLAFRSGAITGMLVAGFALIGVSGYYYILTQVIGLDGTSREVVDSLVALGFGASLISIFARLGGGIFTKGADVGGDMVGKVEAGIPEDDPRNAATIADNVGDNVGDCAGMAADLFETYAVTTVATMVLAAIFFRGMPEVGAMMLLPLAICGVCIVTSILGTFAVRLGKSNNIMGALYQGLIVTGVLSIPAIWWVVSQLVPASVTANNGLTSALTRCSIAASSASP